MLIRIVYIVCPIVIYFIISVLAGLVFPGPPLAAALAGAAAVLPILTGLYRQSGRRLGAGSKALGRNLIPVLLLTGIGACITVNNIIVYSGIAGYFRGYEEVSRDIYEPSVWLQVAAAGFVVPAAEELIFRGLGFRELRGIFGFGAAAFWSSLFFAVYHGNVVQGVYAWICGYILAYVCETCGTVLAPYLVHMAANLTSVAVTCIGKNHILGNDFFQSPLFGVTGAGLLAAGLWQIHHIETAKGEKL